MYDSITYITKLNEPSHVANAQLIADMRGVAEAHDIDCFEYHPGHASLSTNTLFVSIGGDGTMLHAMRESSKVNAATIGINLGRLGFLADTSPENAGAFIERCMSNQNVKFERRHLITCSSVSDMPIAVNEFLVHSGDIASFFECTVLVDGKQAITFSGTGLIIATPTGSTAYSLSLGGNILMPAIDAFMVVPLAAHTLTARPIIVGANSTIDVIVVDSNNAVSLSADGSKICRGNATTQFTFVKNNTDAVIIHDANWNFFDTLTTKMKW